MKANSPSDPDRSLPPPIRGTDLHNAVRSLGGYAYQILVAALDWLDIDEKGQIYLEIAEDYARVVEDVIGAVQVKDTRRSGRVTLASESVRSAIARFVQLTETNPGYKVDLHFFTTAHIGLERAHADRILGKPSLEYWKKTSLGADPEPLQRLLETDRFHEDVRRFVKSRSGEQFREDLIRRVHWQCGKPDLDTLRQEFEKRLIVVGRDRFNIPSQEARRLAGTLLSEVLFTCTHSSESARVLTRADLYSTIDNASRISVPRSYIELPDAAFGRSLSKFLAQSLPTVGHLSSADSAWLIQDDVLPSDVKVIPRPHLESAIASTLAETGTVVVQGVTGIGKSLLARMVAERAGHFAVADLRSLESHDLRNRLDVLLGRIGGLSAVTLVLDDLSHIDDKHVVPALSRILDALRRRNRRLVITSNLRPSPNTLTSLRLNASVIVDCTHFSIEETRSLVSEYGGDPKLWGSVAYLAGGCGHPQLTHAFISGVASHAWPREEIREVIRRGLSSDDVDATRDAARRSLLGSLPEETRTFLYRITLPIGSFPRSVALRLGALTPRVRNPGEHLDRLVGTWVEKTTLGRYRVSPLLTGSGKNTLSSDEQERIHSEIVNAMFDAPSIYASDANMLFAHGLAGKSDQGLVALAMSVVSARKPAVEILSEQFVLLVSARTDRPILRRNNMAAVMLRLAQFKLAVVSSSRREIRAIAQALFAEVETLPDNGMRSMVEATVLVTVLNTLGIANHLDDWISILNRLRTVAHSKSLLRSILDNIERDTPLGGADIMGYFFSVGITGLSSIERLEHVIDGLAAVPREERLRYLTPIDEAFGDYSFLVAGVWATEEKSDDWNPMDAASRYGRMARRTRSWGIPALSIQCSVAQANVLDEYVDDRQGALQAVEEARQEFGNDPMLLRTLAKMHYMHHEHREAVDVFDQIGDPLTIGHPIERAYAFREGAISAAKCGDWERAAHWFVVARDSARTVQVEDVRIMAIGLEADAGVASLEAGNARRALEHISASTEALTHVRTDGGLKAVACHRFVRHAVLWVHSRLTGSRLQIGGLPIAMEPGICSRPNPDPSLGEEPIPHMDITRYALAEAEIAASIDIGATRRLDQRLTGGLIVVSEAALRRLRIMRAVRDVDAEGFVSDFVRYAGACAYVLKHKAKVENELDNDVLERIDPPALQKFFVTDPIAGKIAEHAILAFIIACAIYNRPEAMGRLDELLGQTLGKSFPGAKIIAYWTGWMDTPRTFEQSIVVASKKLIRKELVEPRDYWAAGLLLMHGIEQSDFSKMLMPQIASRLRAGWTRIVTTEAFRLRTPLQTIPSIRKALAVETNDRDFVEKLLSAAAEAVGTSFPSKLRKTQDPSG